ncbi:hypothetical protein FJZ48_03625 [Candidatus Uhrbacteria bacterium]|nr:hypothetical protein [Candidatus Uhrbacteria bacterium]
MPTSVSTKSKTITYAIAGVGIVAAAAFAYFEIFRGGGYRPPVIETGGGTPGYVTPGYMKPPIIRSKPPAVIKLPPQPAPAPVSAPKPKR